MVTSFDSDFVGETWARLTLANPSYRYQWWLLGRAARAGGNCYDAFKGGREAEAKRLIEEQRR